MGQKNGDDKGLLDFAAAAIHGRFFFRYVNKKGSGFEGPRIQGFVSI